MTATSAPTWGRSPGDDGDHGLLLHARAGDDRAVAALYDRHADALYSLARCVLDDGAAAEDAVVGTMVDSCGPGAVGRPRLRSVRHELAGATYRRCQAAVPLSRSARSRAVMALCLHGDHSYREAGVLTGITCAPLGDLLREAVAERGLAVPA